MLFAYTHICVYMCIQIFACLLPVSTRTTIEIISESKGRHFKPIHKAQRNLDCKLWEGANTLVVAKFIVNSSLKSEMAFGFPS